MNNLRTKIDSSNPFGNSRGLTRNFSTSTFLSMEEARKTLEKFQWLNQNKQPDYKQSTDAGSPVLNEVKTKLGTFLKKGDNYIEYQERYISFIDSKADEQLFKVNKERPQAWVDIEEKIPNFISKRDDKVFDLEMKYKVFQQKPAEYYKEALQIEFSNNKKVVQALSNKEEALFDFMQKQPNISRAGPLRDHYLSGRAEYKAWKDEWVRELRKEKKEIEEFIHSNIQSSPIEPSSGSGEGNSGITPSKSGFTDFGNINPSGDSRSGFTKGTPLEDYWNEFEFWLEDELHLKELFDLFFL